MPDISAHEFFFKTFFERFLALEEEDKAPLLLKYEHSLRVLAHVRLLVRSEEFIARAGHAFALLERAALLAALYHDIARFPQFYRWRTFSDKASTNHGRLGVKILKEEKALAREMPELLRLVQSAVILHNRYALPPGLSEETRLVSEAVRDADKVDICRIFAEQLAVDGPRSSVALLSVKDDPALYSPKVTADALARRTASYADLRSVNDFRILLGTWQYALGFAASREALFRAGTLARLLEDLPATLALRSARDQLLADLRNTRRR